MSKLSNAKAIMFNMALAKVIKQLHDKTIVPMSNFKVHPKFTYALARATDKLKPVIKQLQKQKVEAGEHIDLHQARGFAPYRRAPARRHPRRAHGCRWVRRCCPEGPGARARGGSRPLVRAAHSCHRR